MHIGYVLIGVNAIIRVHLNRFRIMCIGTGSDQSTLRGGLIRIEKQNRFDDQGAVDIMWRKHCLAKKEHGCFRMDRHGDEQVVVLIVRRKHFPRSAQCMHVYISIYIALLTFAGNFCKYSCVVLLHLLLFELTPFSFFHYNALHTKSTIAATKTMRLSCELLCTTLLPGYHV